jgi:hypothetical protein
MFSKPRTYDMPIDLLAAHVGRVVTDHIGPAVIVGNEEAKEKRALLDAISQALLTPDAGIERLPSIIADAIAHHRFVEQFNEVNRPPALVNVIRQALAMPPGQKAAQFLAEAQTAR